MSVVPRRQLYLTALTILFVVLLLLVIISVSTYRNLNRERNAAMQTVRRQALTLITALEAGARAGMMLQRSGEDAIGNLIHEIGRSDDINYLYLCNARGEVVHHSNPSMEGSRALWRPTFEGPGEVHTRVRRQSHGTWLYEVAKPFTIRGFRGNEPLSSAADEAVASPAHTHRRDTVYLGMSMAAYESARKSDLQHAIVMGCIVLALGSGVVYFFIVLRSYYALSRTLQKTRDSTRQVIASMAHGVLSVDMEGKVVYHNQQALALLDMTETDIEGLDLQTIFDFKETGIGKTIDAGVPVLNHEMTLVTVSGTRLPLMLTVTPILEASGRRSGAVVVVRDMRAIKQLEEKVRRAEKLAVVGKLAAGVAHEIRNPLSSIRGFAYLLGRDHKPDSPQREYADVMVREIDRINHVVTDLLNFARPMKLEPQAIMIETLIDHVVSLVSPDAKKQGIDIRIDIGSGLPRMHVDPGQVTQAMLNLMLNAISALENGGVLEIRVVLSENGKSIVIHIDDDGPGIDPEILDKIFEPFFTTRERGTGLGLAMVRKIAENHDGRVTAICPPPGKSAGTRFALSLRNMEAKEHP